MRVAYVIGHGFRVFDVNIECLYMFWTSCRTLMCVGLGKKHKKQSHVQAKKVRCMHERNKGRSWRKKRASEERMERCAEKERQAQQRASDNGWKAIGAESRSWPFMMA